jgi:hypothetical protein
VPAIEARAPLDGVDKVVGVLDAGAGGGGLPVCGMTTVASATAAAVRSV